MDYEQKYKDALERARELKNKLEKNCSLATSTGIESIFPELAESEDERIRKEILEYIDKATGCKRWVAWLEKQGKPISRFKVGDKVLWKYDKSVVRTITKVSDCGTYWIECKGCSSGWWTEQQLEPYVDKSEHKPAWSEEDEKILGKCIDAASGYYSPEDKQSMKDWLKSLKDRVQLHWKPTEEQIEAVKRAAKDVFEFSSKNKDLRLKNETYFKSLYSLYEQLEKL